ncbi:MAG: alpha/beta hydrolase family protein, partial [Balneolaceae bacterium]|nr:alpha/beta hydrolase family protein [Balneolaceae bacterium]
DLWESKECTLSTRTENKFGIMEKAGAVFAILLLVVSVDVRGQQGHGVIRESLSLESEILGKEVAYSVYLPPGYEETNRSYPVLYLLHGYTDDETAWIQFGQVKKIADRHTDDVEISSMIIIMPDAGVSWYVNSRDGTTRYEDFFIEEFIPAMESEYRVRGEKEFRAVAGLSMGGYGTLIMALKHPGLFSAAAPLSAGVLTEESVVNMPQDNWDRTFGAPFGKGLRGNERLTKHNRDNSVIDLIRNGNAETLNTVDFYIDCGDDDFLIEGNMELHSVMLEKEVAHEFRVRDGGHGWEYWRTALPEVLRFVSQRFHR